MAKSRMEVVADGVKAEKSISEITVDVLVKVDGMKKDDAVTCVRTCAGARTLIGKMRRGETPTEPKKVKPKAKKKAKKGKKKKS
jgi:hypothetical protein